MPPRVQQNNIGMKEGCCSSQSSLSPVKPTGFWTELFTIKSSGLSQHWPSKLSLAGFMFTTGMLLHQLPTYPGFTDWKVFARPVLGILTVGKLNDAFGLKLPPWLTAIETVGIITPLISGFSVQSLKQFAIIAPIVAVLAQLVSSLNKPVSKKLEDAFKIPPWVTRLALSVGFIALGVKMMPAVYQPLIKSGWLKPVGKGAEVALLQTCPRGCSVGTGGICMSEVMENLSALLGSVGNWFSPKAGNKSTLPLGEIAKGEKHGCCCQASVDMP